MRLALLITFTVIAFGQQDRPDWCKDRSGWETHWDGMRICRYTRGNLAVCYIGPNHKAKCPPPQLGMGPQKTSRR